MGTVQWVNISGLDTFSKFELMDAVSAEVLALDIELGPVEMKMALTLQPADASLPPMTGVVTVGLEKVVVSASTDVLVNGTLLGDLEAEQLLNASCWVNALHRVVVTEAD